MKRKSSNMEREYSGSGNRHSEGWDEEDPFGRMYGDDGGFDDEDPEDEDEEDEDEDEDEDDYDEEDDDSEDEDEEEDDDDF